MDFKVIDTGRELIIYPISDKAKTISKEYHKGLKIKSFVLSYSLFDSFQKFVSIRGVCEYSFEENMSFWIRRSLDHNQK